MMDKFLILGNFWKVRERNERSELQFWGFEAELPGADGVEAYLKKNTSVLWGGKIQTFRIERQKNPLFWDITFLMSF